MSPLFGLRRVSQSFNISICRRSFAHRHFTTQSPTGRILFLASLSLREQCFYSAEIKEDGTLGPATRLPPISVKIYGTDRFQFCNGLLYSSQIDQYYIISPDTGEVSLLPREPRQCWINSGFDPSSNKHKVLIVHHSLWLFRIFTLGSGGSWRTIHTYLPKEKINHRWPRNVVYANGAIHWFYFGSEYVVDHPDNGIYYRIRGRGGNYLYEKCMVCFDMADEQFTRIPFPDDDSFPQYLTEVGGNYLYEKCMVCFDMADEQFTRIPFPDDDSFPQYLTDVGGNLALMEEFMLRIRKMLGYDVVDEEYDKLQYWVLEPEDYKWVKETIRLPFGWMGHNKVVAFNSNTGEMLLTSANRRRNKVKS